MTTHHAEMKLLLGRCQRCDHDLVVVKQGRSAGQVRCSNPECRFATRRYKMGQTANDGPGEAA